MKIYAAIVSILFFGSVIVATGLYLTRDPMEKIATISFGDEKLGLFYGNHGDLVLRHDPPKGDGVILKIPDYYHSLTLVEYRWMEDGRLELVMEDGILLMPNPTWTISLKSEGGVTSSTAEQGAAVKPATLSTLRGFCASLESEFNTKASGA